MNIIFFIICLISIISTVLASITLFKKKIVREDISKIKWICLYAFIIIIYILLFIISSLIYLYNIKQLDTCGNMCQNYTNSILNIIMGLGLYTIITNLFYLISKKIIIKFHNNNTKIKYMIAITYFIINYSISIIGYYVFGGFLGQFIIDNIILNIIRWIIIFEPLLIYPINILLIKKETI